MRNSISTLFGATFLVVCACAGTVAAEEISPKGALYERYDQTALISAEIVKGLMLGGRPSPARPSLEGWIPHSWAGTTFCVRLGSIDGRYESMQAYEVSANWRGGRAALRFPTAYKDILAAIPDDNFSVLIRNGPCEEADGELAPASWNKVADPGTGLSVLVNSFRSDEVYLLQAGADVEHGCSPLASAQRTSFDFRCAIAGIASGLHEFEVNRIRRGSYDLPHTFTLVIE